MRRTTIYLCICMLFALTGRALADSAQATVDRTRVFLGESLTLTVSVEGGGDVDMSEIQDFDVVSRSSGTSISIINGQMTKTSEYRYILTPKKTGELTIPALQAGNAVTEPITVTVLKRGDSKAQGGPGRTDKSAGDSAQQPDPEPDESREMFLQASVSKRSPYVGETVVYTMRLYTALAFTNAQLERPEFSGFNAKQLDDQREYNKIINGRRYRVIEVDFLLTPMPGEQAGEEVLIEPITLHCDVVRRTRRRTNLPFGGFFNDQELIARVFRSDSIRMQVQPLPAYQGEGTFSGLVGGFQVQAEADKTELKTGESATVSITISGRGNIMDAAELAFPKSPLYKVYTDSPEESVSADRQGYSGRKVFRYALVPQEPADFTVPGFSLVYFDPGQGKYVRKSTKPLGFSVTQGAEDTPVTADFSGGEQVQPLKKQVEYLQKDILPLKEGLDGVEDRSPMSLGFFLILFFLPPVGFGIVFLVRRLFGKEADNRAVMTAKAREALKQARAAAGAGKRDKALASARKALTAALNAGTGRCSESLTYEEAELMLRFRGECAPKEPDVADEVLTLMKKLDAAVYGGMGDDPEGLIGRTENAVRKLLS